MEQQYTLALYFLQGASSHTALKILEHYGSAKAFFEDDAPAEPKLRELLPHRAEALRRAGEEMEYCQQSNIEVIPYNSQSFPQRLKECADAPIAIFYCGNADLNAKHVLSIVGTRRITEYGRDICREFTRELAAMLPDVVVVSGLAYGVDICAHRGALQNNMQTIGVLAHGLDRIYPAHHRDTAAKMVRQGGLLTEYPRFTIPEKGNFVRRNRIVAGLADATIVVESAEKGGALITARLAQDYNRDVYAFPGRTTDQYSRGCNALIRGNVASLVTSAEDFLLSQGWITQQESSSQAIQRTLFPELSDMERQILASLVQADQKTISLLVSETSLPFNRVNALLVGMELKGLVRALPGGLYRSLIPAESLDL